MITSNEPAELRRATDTQYSARLDSLPAAMAPADPADPAAFSRLVHELKVHQIELEVQREALCQAQTELEKSRDQYFDLYEFAPIGYCTLNASGCIEKINLTGAEMLGEARGKLLNKQFSACVAAADRDRWQQYFARSVRSLVKNTAEFALQRSDQTVFYAQIDCTCESVAACCASGAGDRGPQLRIALTDVSARKLIEQDLLLSKQGLEVQVAERTAELRRVLQDMHQFIKHAPSGIAMFDRDMTYLAASDRWLVDFGQGQGSLVGQNHYETDPGLPDDWKLAHRQGLLGQTVKNDRFLWRRVDGRQQWWRWTVVPWRQPNGEIGGTIVSAEDISQRVRIENALRESEEMFRGAIANTAIGVSMVLPDGHFIEVNGAFRQLTGYSNQELLGLSFPQLVHPDDRDENLRLFNSLLAGQLSDYVVENRFCRKDGHVVWVRKSISLVRDDQGAPKMAVALVEDVTERKRAEAAARGAMADTERANRAKSRFLAAASHDLRQPLSALKVYVGLLDHLSAPSDQELVANMQNCINSLSELLNDLLDLSKLDAGVVTPCPSDFSVAELFANLNAIHAPEALDKKLRLRFGSSPLSGRTDLILFRRCLGNLVENAIRYTERGGVLVGCRRRQGKLWVEVWDSGVGIAADKMAEVFEEFRQLGDQSRNCGSGLGLAIVAKTAALLGLEINLRSRPGRGSVFALELPLGQMALTMPASVMHTAEFKSLRIALVDDNRLVRDALIAGLQSLGHQVVAAASKAALLDALDQLAPDIVLSDYRLTHGETGFDVIMAVRAHYGAELPAILLTGDTDPNLLRILTRRGIVVLHKPLDLETVQAYMEDMTAGG